jgi:3-methylcrotonyl-CoA carboxylase alpha subunit
MFLANSLADSEFATGKLDTGLIGRKADALTSTPQLTTEEMAAGAILALEQKTEDDLLAPLRRADGQRDWVPDEKSQFSSLLGFRLNANPNLQLRISIDGHACDVDLTKTGAAHSNLYEFVPEGVWSRTGDGFAHLFEIAPRSVGVIGHGVADGAILAPMPGKVTSVDVSKDEKVAKGQRLLTLEAMKMEHGLVAPFDGVVAELNATAGAQVQVDALLARIEKRDG